MRLPGVERPARVVFQCGNDTGVMATIAPEMLSYVEQMAARGIDRTTYIGVVVWGDDFFYGVSLVSDIPDLIPATWIGDVLARAREFSAAGDLPILHLKDGRLLLERRPVSRLNSRGGKG